jgi:Protein of unknown function (DUF1698)
MNILYGARKALNFLLSANRFSRGALDAYVTSAPSAQNAVDILRSSWASRMPQPYANLKAGVAPLFEDERVSWFLEEIGGVAEASILELGPLEGGHSFMMERAGAAEIVAIEGNTQAYLKCLIVKELLELRRVRFLCGDFLQFLRDQANNRMFDVCLASGVLYHMQNPVELLALASARCRRHLLLWTHYYDAQVINSTARLGSKFGTAVAAEHAGFRHHLYQQDYGATLYRRGFCGGSAPSSRWMTRADILGALSFFGFGNVRVGFDHKDHPNGPAFAVVASRDETPS